MTLINVENGKNSFIVFSFHMLKFRGIITMSSSSDKV